MTGKHNASTAYCELRHNKIRMGKQCSTRLHSNLRSTTRKYVHLVTRTVTSGHVTKMAVTPFDQP